MIPDADIAKIMRVGAMIVAVLFCASLALPVVASEYSGSVHWDGGGIILVSGWMGLIVGKFAWFANLLVPIFVLKALSGGRVSWPIMIALASCAIDAVFWYSIPGADREHRIVRFGAGYYLWLAAVLLSVGLTAMSIYSRRSIRFPRS